MSFKRITKRFLQVASLTDWEHWPFYLFYFPISYKWLWYYVKSRSFWFFTASNPTLEFGGFEGESKTRIAQLIPASLYPASIFVEPGTAFSSVSRRIAARGLRYPLIAKPDVGMKGILVRLIRSEEQLETYHLSVPSAYIIQEYLDMPLEVSVFYLRQPGESSGKISALIRKNLPSVCGDGRHTLAQLVSANPVFRIPQKRIRKEFGRDADRVLEPGEVYQLSHIANLYHHANFTNLHREIDARMLRVFDEISVQNRFYYGRYDIKCHSIEELREGKNFKILEFNGSGSVPNHIYSGGYNLFAAYREILRHWKALFEISSANCSRGVRYWDFLRGYRFLRNSKKHFNVLKRLDRELVI